jgi:hypothetical protein
VPGPVARNGPPLRGFMMGRGGDVFCGFTPAATCDGGFAAEDMLRQILISTLSAKPRISEKGSDPNGTSLSAGVQALADFRHLKIA